jgi:orotate phosphoribosyltransferase
MYYNYCEAGWVEEYKTRKALWIHDGNPRRPHALLTSHGKHSNGYVNSELVMQDSMVLNGACLDLVGMLMEADLDLKIVDRVVGPAMGAITLAHELSRNISYINFGRRHCLYAYTQKQAVCGSSKMVFDRTRICPNEQILITEDVLTTGSSVKKTTIAVTEAGAVPLPFVAVLVNRSGLEEINGLRIVALIKLQMDLWDPERCPLCKAGSKPIRPKGSVNWASLNAEY